MKSSEDGANLKNKTIRCIISPELLILIKIFQPYRITAKRIFMENVKKQASSSATKDSISITPRDVLQRYDLLEAHLDKLKPGEYSVCINYKKKGIVELRRNPRPADHLNVLEKVTKEEKNTQAALHRFAVEVRKVYQSGITIIGKTHALKSFGKRIVDAALCIKEANNQYYSCAAPRQYYDKNALVYMKLEQIEDEDK